MADLWSYCDSTGGCVLLHSLPLHRAARALQNDPLRPSAHLAYYFLLKIRVTGRVQ
jgi:hypothetical protein